MIHRSLSPVVTVSLLVGSLAVLTQCTPSASNYQNRGSTLLGQSQTTKFYAQSQGHGAIKTGDLHSAARVIGTYRRMNASEAEILQALAQKKYDFAVALEYEALRPKYEAKIRQVEQRRTKLKQTASRRSSSNASAVASAPKANTAKLERDLDQEVAALKLDWKREANALAQQKIGGSSFAMAVRADQENKSLVGMARVVEDRVEVSRSLLELEKPLLVLDARQSVMHQGREVTVLQTTPVPLTPPSSPDGLSP